MADPRASRSRGEPKGISPHIPPHLIIHGERVRATIPAVEALLAAGNRLAVAGVEVRPGSVMQAAQLAAEHGWTVWLTTPAAGVVLVRAPDPTGRTEPRWAGAWPEQRQVQSPVMVDALRLASEPEYPGEQPRRDAWEEARWTIGCPAKGCGRALLWAEAGYVPGWRVCAGGGHFASLDRLAGVGEAVVMSKGRVHADSQYRISDVAYDGGA